MKIKDRECIIELGKTRKDLLNALDRITLLEDEVKSLKEKK